MAAIFQKVNEKRKVPINGRKGVKAMTVTSENYCRVPLGLDTVSENIVESQVVWYDSEEDEDAGIDHAEQCDNVALAVKLAKGKAADDSVYSVYIIQTICFQCK